MCVIFVILAGLLLLAQYGEGTVGKIGICLVVTVVGALAIGISSSLLLPTTTTQEKWLSRLLSRWKLLCLVVLSASTVVSCWAAIALPLPLEAYLPVSTF